MNEQISPLQIQYLFENYKEHQILDEQLQYLEKYHSRLIKAMREMTGFNPHYTFADETKTIEYLYAELLQERKTFKGREMSFVNKGELVMLNMVKAVEEYGLAEALPKLENKKMFITIKPKSSK